MKNSCLLLCTLFLSVAGHAQSSLDTALKEIERNNPDLKAAAAGWDEDRLANRSEALLANPEIEFNYLWGADDIGGPNSIISGGPMISVGGATYAFPRPLIWPP